MTERTVYNLNVFCTDASNNFHNHNIWTEDLSFTTCPLNIPEHILHEKNIIGSISQNAQVIVDDTAGTNGTYRAVGYVYPVAAGPDIEYQVVGTSSFPYAVRINTFKVYAGPENIGDTFSFVVARNTIIGVLMSDVSNGNTLSVSGTVIANLIVGYEVLIQNGGTGPIESLGEVINIDRDNNIITVSNNISSSFSAGSLIMMTIKRIENIKIMSAGTLTFGTDTAGTSLAPPGLTGTILYKNSTNAAKEICCSLETLY